LVAFSKYLSLVYTSEDLKWNAKGVIDFNLLNINVIFIFKI